MPALAQPMRSTVHFASQSFELPISTIKSFTGGKHFTLLMQIMTAVKNGGAEKSNFKPYIR